MLAAARIQLPYFTFFQARDCEICQDGRILPASVFLPEIPKKSLKMIDNIV